MLFFYLFHLPSPKAVGNIVIILFLGFCHLLNVLLQVPRCLPIVLIEQVGKKITGPLYYQGASHTYQDHALGHRFSREVCDLN